MAIVLQRVGGHELAFGLTWQALQNPEQIDPIFEARDYADEKNARFAVIVGATKTSPMVGLWVDPRKPLRGVVSASALLANVGDGRRLTVAALPDGQFWLSLSNSNGLLDAELCDLVGPAALITNRLDAAATRISATGNREFRAVVIGDVQLNSPWVRNAAQTTWEKVLSDPTARAAANLQALSSSVPRWMVVTGALLLGAGAWAGYSYYRAEAGRAADAAARQLPDADAQRLRSARIAEAVTAALNLDSQTPSPSTQARMCNQSAEAFGWRYHGWRVASIVCEPATNTIKVSLNADYTSFDAPLPSTLKAAADRFGARVEFGADMQTATIQHTIATLPVRPALNREALPRFEQHAIGVGSAISALRSDFDRLGATFGAAAPKLLRIKDPTQRDPTTGTDIEVDVPASESYLTVTIDLSSDKFAAVIGAVAPYERALRLERVEFTPSPDRTTSRVSLTHFLHP